VRHGITPQKITDRNSDFGNRQLTENPNTSRHEAEEARAPFSGIKPALMLLITPRGRCRFAPSKLPEIADSSLAI
jgi:hypothetical protein